MRETKKALIVVRTYPTPAKSGIEVSCTAAISDKGEWLRLYPVPYRLLSGDKRFSKYQWIEVTAIKSSDARPESYKIIPESIQILSDPLSSDNAWQAKKDIITPLQSPSLCHLKRLRDANGFPTLGFFKPKSIDRFVMEPGEADWSERQLAILSQQNLFEEAPLRKLEKVPFVGKYHFYCDDPECTSHKLSCIDWELGASWYRWKKKYGDAWVDKIKERYDTEMLHKYDTHFFVGTIHQHPSEWVIIGLFYPPKEKGSTELTLPFDL